MPGTAGRAGTDMDHNQRDGREALAENMVCTASRYGFAFERELQRTAARSRSCSGFESAIRS